MKKALISILVIFATYFGFSCSSSQAKDNFDEGVAHFKQEQYKWAAQSFSVALIKNPKFADAAYNAGIAYLKLNDTDNALFYFKKTVNISPFHIDAWYNIAVIRYNKNEYKKAVVSAFNALDKGKNLLEKSYKMLASQGFEFRDYAQLKSQPELAIPEFQKDDVKELSFILNIDDTGKVKDISNCSEKDENICKHYENQLKTLEFIPAYDFEREIMICTGAIAYLHFENNSINTVIVTRETKLKHDDNAVIMGALDRKTINEVIKNNSDTYLRCYNDQLKKDPVLGGRVVVNFIISKTGTVSSAQINRSTINNEELHNCITEATKRFQFPKPKGGGIVIVNYPFVFKHTEE